MSEELRELERKALARKLEGGEVPTVQHVGAPPPEHTKDYRSFIMQLRQKAVDGEEITAEDKYRARLLSAFELALSKRPAQMVKGIEMLNELLGGEEATNGQKNQVAAEILRARSGFGI